MTLRRTAILAFVLAVSRIASSQEVRVGKLSAVENFVLTDPHTIVDLAHPANIDGTLTSATIVWNAGATPCSADVKLKFFRPGAYDHLFFLAERGPFSVSNGVLTFSLSPPVSVQKGDLVGFAQLQSAVSCGGGIFTAESAGEHSVAFLGDVSSDVDFCSSNATLFEESPSVEASGAAEVYAGTITGAGSGHGANINFKTEIQLANPGAATIHGRLVFHPIGASGSPSDPSLSYTLARGQVVAFPDAIAALGASGLGSIDLRTQSSYPPVVVTRIFNDQGAAGTFGFSEPFIRPGDPYILTAENNNTAFLVAPTDLTNFRMNLGVRSFVDGTTISIGVFGPDGAGLGGKVRSYGPNVFDQRSAQDFTGVSSIPPNSTIEIQVTSGAAIVFLVSVDDKTGDSALQLADRRLP